MVTDNYWENNPAYNAGALQLVPVLGSSNSYANGASFTRAAGAKAGSGLRGRLGAMFGQLRDPSKFGYSFRGTDAAGPGLTLFGKNIGRYATIGTGVMEGVKAAQGLSNYSKGRQDMDTLKSDILRSAAANPLVNNYLTSEQMDTLNKLRRGSYSDGTTFDDVLGGVGSGLGNTASSAMMGAALGGLPGAIVGGVGGLINSGISGANQSNERKLADLQSLYDALAEAETSYKSMKRPVFTGLGIQRNYQNMYA